MVRRFDAESGIGNILSAFEVITIMGIFGMTRSDIFDAVERGVDALWNSDRRAGRCSRQELRNARVLKVMLRPFSVTINEAAHIMVSGGSIKRSQKLFLMLCELLDNPPCSISIAA